MLLGVQGVGHVCNASDEWMYRKFWLKNSILFTYIVPMHVSNTLEFIFRDLRSAFIIICNIALAFCFRFHMASWSNAYFVLTEFSLNPLAAIAAITTISESFLLTKAFYWRKLSLFTKFLLQKIMLFTYKSKLNKLNIFIKLETFYRLLAQLGIVTKVDTDLCKS